MTRFGSVSKSMLVSIGLLFAAGAANAGQMIAVTEVPNSVQFSTSPIGLNDNGMITGSYVGGDGHQHGFVGQIDGPYTLFDESNNANGTEPRAISNTNWITGLGNADSIDPVNMGTMFEATPALTIMPINKNGVQMLGIPQGFNASNVFVGGYYPPGAPASQVNGFFGLNGQWSSDITLPFPTIQVRARGINNSGTVVGLFFTASSTGTSGFIMKNGTVTVINYPDPTQTGTNLEGINDAGVMTGSYSDVNGLSHSFLLAADMTTFTLIEPAGSLDNQAWAINKDGEVAISSDVGPFIYCSKNGNGHCKNGKAKLASEVTVRGAPRTFVCINGCRGGGVATNMLRGPAVRVPVQRIDLRAKPYKRVQ